MKKLATLTAVATIVAALGFAGTAKAATGLGPSEYLCFDTAATTATGDCAGKDSPFAGLPSAFFHLEDFEDGVLNTPGVSAAGQGLQFLCQHPSQDSVDEDDGTIDGSGLGGCSLFSTSSGTGTNTAEITFTFDENDLGMFPTHVGIVWTDGLGEVGFNALDENGSLIADCTSSADHTGLNDGFGGQTAEDRFYGCINDTGISIIEISTNGGASATGIEVDHLQYGKIDTLACVAAPSGLVSWWPGDGDANDIINANDPFAQSGVSFVAGKVGQGITLASDGFIDIADNPNLEQAAFTIDAWVKPKAPSTSPDSVGDVVFQKARCLPCIAQASYHLSWSSADLRWHVLLGHTDDTQTFHASSNTYAADQFYHVAVTYDGTLRLYVDGVLDFSVVSDTPILYSSEQAVIGANAKIFRDVGFPRSWQGVIDELEFFDRALTGPATNCGADRNNEICDIFLAGPAGKCKEEPCFRTIGFWKNHSWENAQFTINGVGSIDESTGQMILSDAKSKNFSMLFAQLIAAKLNCLDGCPSEILTLIAEAETFLDIASISASTFEDEFANKMEKRGAVALSEALDAFNNSIPCDDVECASRVQTERIVIWTRT